MRVLLCDDNQEQREKYRKLILETARKHNVDIDLVVYDNGKQLLFQEEDRKFSPDIIFLDINMPEINGIQVAEKLRKNGCIGEIIFLTISREFMLPAFDVRAFNYILKDDNSNQRLERIFEKAAQLAEEKQQEYMLFTGVGEYRNVPISSIRYFEVNQKIVTVYYGQDSFEFVSTIGKLENLLFTKGFVRIHRSYLVSVARVESFSYEEVHLYGGVTLPVGRKYYSVLKEAMSHGPDR